MISQDISNNTMLVPFLKKLLLAGFYIVEFHDDYYLYAFIH